MATAKGVDAKLAFSRAASRAASARSTRSIIFAEPDEGGVGDESKGRSNASSKRLLSGMGKKGASMKRLASSKSFAGKEGELKRLASKNIRVSDEDRLRSMTSRSTTDKEAHARAQQLAKEMAMGALEKMTAELDSLEDHLQAKKTMTLADMQALDEAQDAEKVLRVKWHAHVRQAKTDLERDAIITSLAEKSDAYRMVMGRLLAMNRNPPLDYLLTEFDEPEETEDGRRHGAMENLLQFFDGLTSIVHSTLDAPSRLGLKAIGVEDGPNEKLSEWRELSSLVEKIGREQEVFTGYASQYMRRAANGVDANGFAPGGVREAKAALNALLKAFQSSVTNLREVEGVWGDDERKADLLHDWVSTMSKDVGGAKKMQRLEEAVKSLEADLEESDAGRQKLEKKLDDVTREYDTKLLEMDAHMEMLTTERDRTMEVNETLTGEVEDLQGDLELAKQKANWVDTLEREKTRLMAIRDQLERKVGDLQTDIADHHASSKKMKEEFAELLKEVQVARGDKAEHIQTAAQLVEVTAELQAAQASIEDLEATLGRVRASVELDCQAAEARGAAGAEALAKELRNDLQKMGNEANEIKSKWKSAQGQVKALEEELEKARERSGKDGSSTPEPELPDGAITQEASVHEVVDFLEEYQDGTLDNPLERADFVESLESRLGAKLRSALVEAMKRNPERNPELAAMQMSTAVPGLDLQTVAQPITGSASAQNLQPQVSCRDDGSAMSSHRTIQGSAAVEEKQLTSRPDTEEQATMTDGTGVKSSAQQTEMKTFVDCEVATDVVKSQDAALNTLISKSPHMQMVDAAVGRGSTEEADPASSPDVAVKSISTTTSKTVEPSRHVSRSSTVCGDVVDSLLRESVDELQAEDDRATLLERLGMLEKEKEGSQRELELLRTQLQEMGLLFSDNRKELKEKNATVGTQALRNKVLEKRAADMEELRLEVERLKRNLQDATAESGRALKRVGDLQEEVVAYMESGRVLAEENCTLEAQIEELEERLQALEGGQGGAGERAPTDRAHLRSARSRAFLQELHDAEQAVAHDPIQVHITITEAAPPAVTQWPTVQQIVRLNPFLQEVVALHPHLNRTITLGRSSGVSVQGEATTGPIQSNAQSFTGAHSAEAAPHDATCGQPRAATSRGNVYGSRSGGDTGLVVPPAAVDSRRPASASATLAATAEELQAEVSGSKHHRMQGVGVQELSEDGIIAGESRSAPPTRQPQEHPTRTASFGSVRLDTATGTVFTLDGSPLPGRGSIVEVVGKWWEAPERQLSLVVSRVNSNNSESPRRRQPPSGPVVEAEAQTEVPLAAAVETSDVDCQTEFAVVEVDAAMALMDAPLARADILMRHLLARIDLLEQAGQQAEQLLSETFARSVGIENAGVEMEILVMDLATSVDGLKRDAGAVLSLFPPMQVEPSFTKGRWRSAGSPARKSSTLPQGLEKLKWGTIPPGATRPGADGDAAANDTPGVTEGASFKPRPNGSASAFDDQDAAGTFLRGSYPQPAEAQDSGLAPASQAGDLAGGDGGGQQMLLGSFPMYNGENAFEVKAKLQQSVDLLTEVAGGGQLGSLQPRVHQELEGLIRSYSSLLERVESFERQGGGGAAARKKTPEQTEDLKRIQRDTHQANQRLTQLGRYKSFRNAVNEKIKEWEAQMCKVAGMSPEMQDRYETAHRKALLRMAEFLVARFRKAEKLLASAVYVKPTAPRNAGVASVLAAPADPWEDTISLYQRVPTPPTHHDKLIQSGLANSAYGHVKQQAFGLTEDWRKRKLAGQTGLGSGSPRPSPRGDPDDSDLRVGKAGSGWRPHVTGDHAEARSSRSATGTGEDSPRRERVKLPEVRSATARKSKQQKQPQESHASYQVHVREAPKLGIMGGNK